ncbi:hypothetical protein HMPREF3156_02535, partial [Neisseria sp. HMSC06F02]
EGMSNFLGTVHFALKFSDDLYSLFSHILGARLMYMAYSIQ